MAPDLLHSWRDGEKKKYSHFFFLLTVLLVWNIYLQIQQSEHSQRIKDLYTLHLKLKHGLLEVSPHNIINRQRRDVMEEVVMDEKEEGHKEEEEEDEDEEEDESTLTSSPNDGVTPSYNEDGLTGVQALFPSRRVRRDTGKNKNKRAKRQKKEREEKTHSPSAAHFVAYVDEERMAREIAEGRTPEIGEHSEGGSLIPREQIYRFWKPQEWTKKAVFNYSLESGKVKIQKKGLYLLYAQIVFHGPSARKSYGIHVNDEYMPYVESIAFDNINSRTKRYVLSTPDNTTSSASVPRRHRRHGTPQQYSSYSQCNTLAIAKLKSGDEVFIRAMEQKRPVIPKSYLTFWGMVKL